MTLGGDDPKHDLPDKEKDALEAKLRADARFAAQKELPGGKKEEHARE